MSMSQNAEIPEESQEEKFDEADREFAREISQLGAQTLSTLSRRSRRRMAHGYRAHQRGDLATALRCYVQVIADQPTNPIALHYAALLATQLNQYAKQEKKLMAEDEAMRLMALSVALAPNNAAGVHNFAKFKHDRGELEDARQLYEIAVSLNPQLGESWTNLGNVWGEFGDREQSEYCWNQAMKCPTDGAADARFNLSMLKLLRGQYLEGWADYESRWDCPGFRYGYGRPDLAHIPRWDGQPLEDSALLVHAEQGIGDALMMARYVHMASLAFDTLILETFPSTVELFRETFIDSGFGNVIVLPRGEVDVEQPTIRAHLPLMSFPAVMRTTVETVPKPARYGWKSVELAPERGRFGLCWKGSASHPNDRTRSMPFESLAPILRLTACTFQSLQFGESPEPLDPLVSSNYLDTARAIARCELVITVDTSIAHLAASMGVPTWILLPFNAEWRWMQDRTDTPWYPAAELFRQPVAGDWSRLCGKVAMRLRAVMEGVTRA